MIGFLSDRLILRPSRNPIETVQKDRMVAPFGKGEIEIWCERVHGSGDPAYFVLKLVGVQGRAERATPHPVELWPDQSAEVWTLNPPGYGGSPGGARLAHLPDAADAAMDALERRAAGRPILVAGNSLGGAVALYLLAQQRGVAGAWIRNPAPLRQTIRRRFRRWWNLWIGAEFVGWTIPRRLDALANARRATAPALFVMSERDSVVPPDIQRTVHDQYGGEYRLATLCQADHADPVGEPDVPAYLDHARWLREVTVGRSQANRSSRSAPVET